jgi:hypothetical protein
MFSVGAIHLSSSPLEPHQHKTEKEILKFFKTILTAVGIKVKHAHHITRHIWLRLFTKASTHILFRYAPQNIRYAETLWRNVTHSAMQIVYL